MVYSSNLIFHSFEENNFSSRRFTSTALGVPLVRSSVHSISQFFITWIVDVAATTCPNGLTSQHSSFRASFGSSTGLSPNSSSRIGAPLTQLHEGGKKTRKERPINKENETSAALPLLIDTRRRAGIYLTVSILHIYPTQPTVTKIPRIC